MWRKIYNKIYNWCEDKWNVYRGYFIYHSSVSALKYDLREKWGVKLDMAGRMHMVFHPSADAVEVYGLAMVEEELKQHLSEFNGYIRAEGVSDLVKRESIRTIDAYNIAVVMGYRYGHATTIMRWLLLAAMFPVSIFLMLSIKIIFGL